MVADFTLKEFGLKPQHLGIMSHEFSHFTLKEFGLKPQLICSAA